MIRAPFMIHRVNGLPADALNLGLHKTNRLLRELDGIEAEIGRNADHASDLLYQRIPLLDDPQQRRDLLALRRALHNGKLPRVSTEQRASWCRALGADAGVLERHLDTFDRRNALQTAAEDAYRAEADDEGERLAAILDHPAFVQSLAHASPDLVRYLQRWRLRPGSKPARTLLAYASRAALKTSPFSRFTALALDNLPADGSARIAPAQQDIRGWLDDLARDDACARIFLVAANSSAVTVNDHRWLITPDVRPGTALAWRGDALVDGQLYADVLDTLTEWGVLPVDEFLMRLGGDDPFGAYLRLLDTHLIRIVLPWSDSRDSSPLTELADLLDTADTAAAQQARDLQRRVELLNQAQGPARLAALDSLRLDGRRVSVYEDAVSDIAVDVPGAHLTTDLQQLGELIRPYIFRSHVYDWIVEQFVARYGPGGRCDDAYAFLISLATRPDFLNQLGKALAADRAMLTFRTDRAWLPASVTSAPPSTTVLYQLAAKDNHSIAEGAYQLVVNQFNPGLGGLVARFRHLLDPTDNIAGGLTSRLRQWVTDAFPHATPHEVTLCADLNSMQRDSAGIFPPFRWPAEPENRDSSASPPRLMIWHERAQGTLLLTNVEGLPIAPVYLGVVPAHLMSGPVRLLLCLSDPWVNGAHHLCCTYSPLEQLSEPGADIVEEPRQSIGRLVTRRRNWRMSASHFPTPHRNESPFDFYKRMDQWRREHDLPDEVFLTLEGGGRLTQDYPDRKPAWISFNSAHAVRALASNPKIGVAQAVRLAEALPHREQYWLRDGEDRTRAAEHVSFLRWDRPNPRSTPTQP
ncbi:hypothetical protein KRMM14A1259_18930 [Krasilnikovia sp. MM14-A1259]